MEDFHVSDDSPVKEICSVAPAHTGAPVPVIAPSFQQSLRLKVNRGFVLSSSDTHELCQTAAPTVGGGLGPADSQTLSF